MAIKQNSDGTFSVSFHRRHPKTKQPITLRRVGICSKAEANRVQADLICLWQQRVTEKEIPSWTKLLEQFELSGIDGNLNPKTLENYLICLRAHTLPAWEGLRIEEITGSQIRSLILTTVGHRSVDHQRSMLKFFRAVFQFAFEQGYVKQNPTPQMKLPKREKLQQVLTVDQAQRLLEQAKIMSVEWYPIWVMALYTGMRNGELYALTWDKVNIEGRQIKVDTSWNKGLGFKSTKSGEGRYLEIAPPLMVLLREMKLRSVDNFVLPRIPEWAKGEQARQLRLFLAGLGLPRIRFHDLRATWATLMLSKGIEPIKVMKMGGWKDLKTMQVYVRKAGVDIKGITDSFLLHNPSNHEGQLLDFRSASSTM